ncbi:exopolysaccharide biosynthesis polyprenyl glycosylphosphotransferase [Streptomyces sp. MUM 203J]|nr:exopolysaccharide biosynthesis polyprenyl glycosylphosphotransferase [Streptomyces sp. MUM 203J]
MLVQLTLVVVVLHACAGLYRVVALGALPAGRHATALDELPALAGRVAVAWCAVVALSFTPAPGTFGEVAAGYVLHLAALAVCRAAVHHRRRRAARDQPRSALVVGPAPAAQRLAALLHQHPEYGVRAVGTACSGQDIPQPAGAEPTAHPLPLLTSAEDIQRAVIQNCVHDALFVGADDAELQSLLRQYGCTTWHVGAATGTGVPMGRHLWGYEFRVLPDPAAVTRRGRLPKRVLDVTFAGVMLVAAAPVLLLCGAAVRLSGGPGVLFRQERVGEHGRLFTLLKFRTLRPESEIEAATRWNVAHDHRLGAVGSFLRRTSLDELPQLWNVLRGDMSLVGPRPERPFFVERFSRLHPGYAARHRMPVGLTGLAQVHGLRGDTSIEDRCRFDNHYIDHWSLWQDVCILLRTAATLIRPAGG